MAINRYARSQVIRGGVQLSTSNVISVIRNAVSEGRIDVQERILQGAERLDVIAGELYGDAQNWWVIAAASDIGWALQVPPGTSIKIPELATTLSIIGSTP